LFIPHTQRSFEMKHCFFPAIALLALGLASGAEAVEPSRPLNDTGVRFCGAAVSTNANPICVPNPSGQDRQYGRDAAAADGQLVAPFAKVGGSADSSNGFDFTKIANNGTVLAAGIALGSGTTDWACTRDNVTGLMWEVKVNQGGHPRDMNNIYTWTAAGTYVMTVNASSLCGHTDWRLPTIQELSTIVDYGQQSPSPMVDPSYFPNTVATFFWSSSIAAPDTELGFPRQTAWALNFGPFSGEEIEIAAIPILRSEQRRVRLVRGG
jgi:hypothetical protein